MTNEEFVLRIYPGAYCQENSWGYRIVAPSTDNVVLLSWSCLTIDQAWEKATNRLNYLIMDKLEQ